jgi:hypothetical protein
MIPQRQPGVAVMPGLNRTLVPRAPEGAALAVPAPATSVFKAVEKDGVVQMVPSDAPAAVSIPVTPQIEGRAIPVVQSDHTRRTPADLLSQLQQFVTATHDKSVKDAQATKQLVEKGLAVKSGDYTILTKRGLAYLIDFGLLG